MTFPCILLDWSLTVITVDWLNDFPLLSSTSPSGFLLPCSLDRNVPTSYFPLPTLSFLLQFCQGQAGSCSFSASPELLTVLSPFSPVNSVSRTTLTAWSPSWNFWKMRCTANVNTVSWGTSDLTSQARNTRHATSFTWWRKLAENCTREYTG